MKYNKSTNKYIIIMQIIIIICTILILATIAVSRNKTKIETDAKVGIAKPIIEFEKISENNIITENSHNVDYCFKIKNYLENNEINQIAQKVTLEFFTENKDNINKIDYSLYLTNSNYDLEELINLSNNKSESITLDANENEDKYFKLRINGVNSDSSFKESLYIKIISESIQL